MSGATIRNGPKGARAECPDPSPHTHDEIDARLDYVSWHDWAREMGKTHRQRRCPNCGLYAVWVPREASE